MLTWSQTFVVLFHVTLTVVEFASPILVATTNFFLLSIGANVSDSCKATNIFRNVKLVFFISSRIFRFRTINRQNFDNHQQQQNSKNSFERHHDKNEITKLGTVQ